MGEKKVTTMVLKVDLQCHKCYKKVKKVLCKFPQIRDQIYDEKQNQVVIKVVCCSPEKIRDKICCKGGGAIKSIEIKQPEKPKPPSVEKPKEAEKAKPADKPKEPEKPKPAKDDDKPREVVHTPKKEEKPAKDDGKLIQEPPLPPPQPVPCVPGYPPPVRASCMDYYQEHAGGPCHSGYGGGPAPYIQYDGYYGRPVYDSYGGGSRGYCEENPSACTVM